MILEAGDVIGTDRLPALGRRPRVGDPEFEQDGPDEHETHGEVRQQEHGEGRDVEGGEPCQQEAAQDGELPPGKDGVRGLLRVAEEQTIRGAVEQFLSERLSDDLIDVPIRGDPIGERNVAKSLPDDLLESGIGATSDRHGDVRAHLGHRHETLPDHDLDRDALQQGGIGRFLDQIDEGQLPQL